MPYKPPSSESFQSSVFHVYFVLIRVIYVKMGRKLFPKGMPPPEVIWDQIQLAQLSTTVYAMLPVLGEFFIEEGYTR